VNNRPIKFRAWSITGKCMYNWEQITVNQGSLYKFFLWPDVYELMQFAAKPSKTGVEIYEGDLIKFTKQYKAELPAEAIFEVVYRDAAFCGENTDWLEYLGELMDTGDVEVIGNIYEHQHLLQEVR